jgi:hypothetical protein
MLPLSSTKRLTLFCTDAGRLTLRPESSCRPYEYVSIKALRGDDNAIQTRIVPTAQVFGLTTALSQLQQWNTAITQTILWSSSQPLVPTALLGMYERLLSDDNQTLEG